MAYELPENKLAGFMERVAHLSPDRVSVLSGPMEGRPGHLAYQITGSTPEDVQREIDRIMADVDVRGGVAEFRNPAKSREAAYFGRWQSCGYTRLEPVLEAAE